MSFYLAHMRFEGILFDSDGVLVNTENLFLDANNHVLSELGISHTRNDFISYTFKTGEGTHGYLIDKGYDDAFINAFWKKRDALWYDLVKSEPVIKSETLDLILQLKKVYKVGIVTNSNKSMLEAAYRDSFLLDKVDLIVTKEMYSNPKPAPDCYLKAISELNIPADQIIAVEDSPRGIAAAKSAGLKAVHIQNKHFPEVTADADFKITDISELMNLLNS